MRAYSKASAQRLEEAFQAGRLPPAARAAYERLAWALDVDVSELGAHLARLGLPERGWVLVLGRFGWRPGMVPPGAELLAAEGLLDLTNRTLTRKGAVVLEALEALLEAFGGGRGAVLAN